MTAFAIAYGLCTALLIALGVLAFWRDRKNRANRDFALFSLFMAAWLASLHLFYRVDSETFLTPIGRANFAAIVLAVAHGYLFTRELVDRPSRRRFLILSGAWGLALLAAFTPLVSASEARGADGQLVTSFGFLFPAFVVHLVGYIGAAVAALITAQRTANAEQAALLRLVLFGFIAMAAITLTTNLVLPAGFGYFGLQEAGALSVVFLIGAFAYAVIVRHLFDIRVVIGRTVVFASLIGSLIGLYGALALFATQALRKDRVSLQEFLFNLLAVTAVGLTSEPLRKWFASRTDQWLYQKDYEQQAVVGKLNQDLSAVFDLDEALRLVVASLSETLHLTRVAALSFEPGDDGKPVIKTMIEAGHGDSIRSVEAEGESLASFFAAQSGPLELGRSGDKRPEEAPTRDSAMATLEALSIAVAIPLKQRDQLIGLLLLGNKGSGDRFTRRDIAFAELVGAPALSAIQKAKLYEGDQAKTEFVSIAAHELLTPITGMQGYLSMVLDEGMGQVDARAKGYLEKVASSAKRLAALVKDLLSISRMESGRVKIDPRPVDVEALIQDAVDQVAPAAAAKGLALTVDFGTALPRAFADPDRLMEVLVNLIGNAIKYTPKGSVTVRTRLDGVMVKVSVEDTGLGMTEEARKQLFTKFYRVRTTETESIQGTGLGLYVTKSMVEKMGGTISVLSAPGAGSVFSFTVPTQRPENLQG